MEIVLILFPCLVVILNLIELSSQAERFLDEAHHLNRSQTHSESSVRARSRSPTLRQTFPSVLGFRFENLALIRLRPHINPNQVFELRRYVFPPDQTIVMRMKNRVLTPMPSGEQIVLSTSNGDVCAILHKSSSRHTILRGIFKLVSGRPKRAKINMDSGKVEEMTEDEGAECRVSTHEHVTKNYGVSSMNSQFKGFPDDEPNPSVHHCGPYYPPSASSPLPAEQTTRARSRSPTLRQTFPTILGFRYDDLGIIRLTAHNYPNRIFELRKYFFPPDAPIGLKTKNQLLNPIPIGDQIVLSTSNGDICALLVKSTSKNTRLRLIFTSIVGITERVKINMNSGAVERMTTEEIAECPGTYGEPITRTYRTYLV